MNELDGHETPGWRYCHWCQWRIYVTSVDLVRDAREMYGLHLRRHAEALTTQAAEDAIFRRLTDELYDNPNK